MGLVEPMLTTRGDLRHGVGVLKLQYDRLSWWWALGAIALVVGVGSRLYLAVIFSGNYDEASYEIVRSIMLRGGNVYAETNRYNYSPLWAYILLGLAHLATQFGVAFHVIVRGFLTLVDVGDAILIGLIVARRNHAGGFLAFSLYLLNPVAILLVGYHGQFENLALAPLLAALVVDGQRPTRSPKALIWLLGTLSLLIKHLTVFSVWTLFVYTFDRKQRLPAMVLSVVVFLGSFLPYIGGARTQIIQNVFLYNSGVGGYGLGSLLLVEQNALVQLTIIPRRLAYLIALGSFDLVRLAFVGVMLALPLIARSYLKLPLIPAMSLSSIALLAFIYGIGEQYFIVPVLLGTLQLGVPYVVYTIAATIGLLTSPFGVMAFPISTGQVLNYPPFFWTWNAIWLVTLAWLAIVVRNANRERSQGVSNAAHDQRHGELVDVTSD